MFLGSSFTLLLFTTCVSQPDKVPNTETSDPFKEIPISGLSGTVTWAADAFYGGHGITDVTAFGKTSCSGCDFQFTMEGTPEGPGDGYAGLTLQRTIYDRECFFGAGQTRAVGIVHWADYGFEGGPPTGWAVKLQSRSNDAWTDSANYYLHPDAPGPIFSATGVSFSVTLEYPYTATVCDTDGYGWYWDAYPFTGSFALEWTLP